MRPPTDSPPKYARFFGPPQSIPLRPPILEIAPLLLRVAACVRCFLLLRPRTFITITSNTLTHKYKRTPLEAGGTFWYGGPPHQSHVHLSQLQAAGRPTTFVDAFLLLPASVHDFSARVSPPITTIRLLPFSTCSLCPYFIASRARLAHPDYILPATSPARHLHRVFESRGPPALYGSSGHGGNGLLFPFD